MIQAFLLLVLLSVKLKVCMSTEWVVLSDKIYEFQKGIRPLFLYTVGREALGTLIGKLESAEIDYHMEEISSSSPRINLFFGKPDCIQLVREMVAGRSLSKLSPEEDFILGALLGYDICQQCDRYRRRKTQERVQMAL